MRECERLFGAELGRRVQELAETSIGGPCPCLVGAACPLTAGSGDAVRLTLLR